MFSWTIFSLKQKPEIILRFQKRGVNYEPVGTIGLNAQKKRINIMKLGFLKFSPAPVPKLWIDPLYF